MFTETNDARVLILTADVGDGHLAAGRALQEHLAARYDIEAQMQDGLALLGAAAQHLIRDGYRRQLEVAPWAFNLSYRTWRSVRPLQAVGGRMLYLTGRRRLGALLRERRPDVVVSTHPALTAALARMRMRGEVDAAVCAMVLDLTDNPMWCHRGADRHIVMHPIALPWVRRYAGGGSVVACHPLVSPRFVVPQDRDAVRARLDVAADEVLVVISGGGWGVGMLADGADAALAAGADHIVVLAGRNARLREDLSRRYAGEPRVRVRGFTDQMPQLLGGADALVHGTGGMTSHEALACGCPLIGYGTTLPHVREHNRALAELGLCRVAEDRMTLEAILREHVEGAPRPSCCHDDLPGVDCAGAVLAAAPARRRTRRRLRLHPLDAPLPAYSMSVQIAAEDADTAVALSAAGA